MLAGVLAGYLLRKVYYTRVLVTPEVAAFVITQINSVLVAAFGSAETWSRVLWVMNRLILAMPGALLFGLPIGIALRCVAHKRLLLYSVLAWPLGTYAYTTFVIRVVESIPEGEQVALWHFRGVAAVDSFFIYSLFFMTVYFAFLLSTRMRPHNTRSTRTRAKTARAGGRES